MIKYLICLLSITLTFGIEVTGQDSVLDTIYSRSGTLGVQIKEITDDVVKYVYPNEDILISLNKNQITKIKFKSGRVQEFTAGVTFREIDGWTDWEDVSITTIESEIKGLYRLEEVTAKARGTTGLSNMNKVKDRAMKKLKIECAMLGGNVIYMMNMDVEGNRSSIWGTDPSETNLSGVAYSTKLPSVDEFKKLYEGSGGKFEVVQYLYQGNNSPDVNESLTKMEETIQLTRYDEIDQTVMVTADIKKLPDVKFRLIRIKGDTITLMYKDKKKLYNLILKGVE